jgi:uncharacterized protein with von Willebrand factor type A (vWA) domain
MRPLPPGSQPAANTAGSTKPGADASAGPGADPSAEAVGPFDRPYDALAVLPRPVWMPTLVAATGSREQRLADSAAWMRSLGEGRLPDVDADFGDRQATPALRRIVGELGLPALCRGVGTLAEQVLRTLLWHLDHLLDLQPALSREQAIEQTEREFRDAWRIETAGIDEELKLLRDLADTGDLQWDRLKGQLRSREWATARRAAERLSELPELAALIRRLGRCRQDAAEAPSRAPEPRPSRRPAPLRAVETRIPGAPGELTGIRFDHRIEGMLASEAVLLNHPLARRLWQARWAEGRLLAHDTQAVLVDWRPDPQALPREALHDPTPEPLARGPIVLCLDTSGSMRGAPESIAKAVVIAALRASHAGQRACKLIAFGGEGELIERDLHRDDDPAQGLAALLELMGQSFDGGTDIQTPIERALRRLHDAAWRQADLLIVSDGEFGCLRETLTSLDDARADLGLRVQGVLVGDRETMGLLEVCDDIHWVRDWRRHADDARDATGRSATGTPAFSPVHSKSLTALYFPNALSSHAQRHHSPQGKR